MRTCLKLSFFYVFALLAGMSVRADMTLEKADTLVGKTVIIKNIYRKYHQATITKINSERELAAASQALQSALNKYPASFISKVLKTVYVGSEVVITKPGEKTEWGGRYHYADLSIFMAFNGDGKAFEQVFHHELAHGIHFAFMRRFDERAWLAANPQGFQYTGEIHSKRPIEALRQLGFVRGYAMCNLREDVACLAQEMVGNPDDFASLAARHPRLKQKATVLIRLYQSVDPVMTLSYFRLQQAASESQNPEDAEDAARERGRPILVSAQSERGVFLGQFKKGDRLTLFYRDRITPSRSRTTLTFAPSSPSNIKLCRRRKVRTEPDLTVLAAIPRLTHTTSFTYTFDEACAAVLKMDGETAAGVDRAKFEFQIDRNGRP